VFFVCDTAHTPHHTHTSHAYTSVPPTSLLLFSFLFSTYIQALQNVLVVVLGVG
jgi:hypothetical protein